jgi:hypothetical protein
MKNNLTHPSQIIEIILLNDAWVVEKVVILQHLGVHLRMFEITLYICVCVCVCACMCVCVCGVTYMFMLLCTCMFMLLSTYFAHVYVYFMYRFTNLALKNNK